MIFFEPLKRDRKLFPHDPFKGTVVFGQVIGMHIDERCMKDGRFDLSAVQPIARCGYDEYAVVERVFSMSRPSTGGDPYGGEKSKP